MSSGMHPSARADLSEHRPSKPKAPRSNRGGRARVTPRWIQRWRASRRGDELPRGRKPPHFCGPECLRNEFWRRVDRSAGENGCWAWTGPAAGGYASFSHGQYAGETRGHRFALMLAGYRMGEGDWALHKCNNPICVRVHPQHVYRGDALDNARDRALTGTYTPPLPAYNHAGIEGEGDEPWIDDRYTDRLVILPDPCPTCGGIGFQNMRGVARPGGKKQGISANCRECHGTGLLMGGGVGYIALPYDSAGPDDQQPGGGRS